MREIVGGLSASQQKWLDVAIKIAGSSEQRQKHGCIIISSGNPIAVGINKYKNSPDTIKDMPGIYSRHAEQDAIARAGMAAKGATIYVARVSRQGLPMLSRPCFNCHKAIVDAGITKIVYTN